MSPKLKVFAEGLTLSERYIWHWSDDSVGSLGQSRSPAMSLAINSKSAFPARVNELVLTRRKPSAGPALGCKSMICALPDEPFFGTEVAKGGWRCFGQRIWRVLLHS